MTQDPLRTIKRKTARLKELAALGQLKIHFLAASFVLLLIATVFEGFSFGLLVPFLKQAAGMGAYEGWKSIPVVGTALKTMHFESISHRIDWILFIIVAAVIIRQLTAYGSQMLYYAATLMFEAKLRIAGYERLLSYGCSFFDSSKKGELHNTLMRFTQEVAEMMRQIFALFQNSFFAVVYIVVLINVSPPLSITAMVLAPIFYGFLRTIFSHIHRLYKQILRHEQKNHGLSYDVFSNIKLVKAMGRESDESENFKTTEQGRARDNILAYSLYLVVAPLQEILMTLGIAVIIWVAFAFYFKNDPSFLIKLIVSLLLFRRALSVLNSFFSTYPQVIRRIPFVQEYRALVEVSDKEVVSSGSKAFVTLAKGIEYRGVSMGYSDKEPILHNVSLFIPTGSFTAIVGASGTGKSTLVELLPRFYEFQSGEILIDDIPIRQYDLKTLRQSMGFVAQDTLVLNDTIYNNIVYAKPNASEAEVLEAADQAKVSDFTKGLANGLYTAIGDKGVKLSGGELQRLAIARVILRKPQILILDEATSALDSVSEQMIQETLDHLAKGRTTIAIAHRLSTIRHADLIVVIDHGEIAEQGTLDNLLSRKGLFYRYWQAQHFE